MRKIRTRIASAATIALIGVAGHGVIATPDAFDADLVIADRAHGDGSDTQLGRIFVSGRKVRMDLPAFDENFFLFDADRQAVWFVRPRQHVFMDAKQSTPLTSIFVPIEADSPCQQWRAMTSIAGADLDGWYCERAGGNVIDGRRAVKYEITDPRHTEERWVDAERAFPIRVETSDGLLATVERVVDEPQPPQLFQIPTDFQRFDSLQLIEQMKHSDAWFEPTK